VTTNHHTHTITPSDWRKYVRAQGTETMEYIVDWIAGHPDVPEDDAESMRSTCR
jgi:hypothetical protein